MILYRTREMNLMPQSFPLSNPQPNAEVYGVPALELFGAFSRESYRAQYGKEAPAFDQAKPPKYWLDESDHGEAEEVPYLFVRSDGQTARLVTRHLTPAEAGEVNIPPDGAIPGVVLPAVPIPVRPLLPNETLVMTPFGVQVVRTDLRFNSDRLSGKFLPEDRALLERIAAKLGV